MTDAVTAVKRAAVEAVEASKPVRLLTGRVIGASPLEIQTDQKIVYRGKMLLLTRNVTNYELTVGENGVSRTLRAENALKVGERVLLARVQQGKRFVVLDRLGEA